MDETTTTVQSGSDAWALSALGQGIAVLVDRTLNSAQTIQPSTGYGVDPATGQLYKLGQPTTTTAVTPVSSGGSMQMLLLIGLVLLVANHG